MNRTGSTLSSSNLSPEARIETLNLGLPVSRPLPRRQSLRRSDHSSLRPSLSCRRFASWCEEEDSSDAGDSSIISDISFLSSSLEGCSSIHNSCGGDEEYLSCQQLETKKKLLLQDSIQSATSLHKKQPPRCPERKTSPTSEDELPIFSKIAIARSKGLESSNSSGYSNNNDKRSPLSSPKGGGRSSERNLPTNTTAARLTHSQSCV